MNMFEEICKGVNPLHPFKVLTGLYWLRSNVMFHMTFSLLVDKITMNQTKTYLWVTEGHKNNKQQMCDMSELCLSNQRDALSLCLDMSLQCEAPKF